MAANTVLRGCGIVLAALLAVAVAQTPKPIPKNELLDSEDTRVVKMSDEAVTLYCEGGWKGGDVDREAGRKQLIEGAGGKNVMLEIMTDAKDQEDMSKQAEEKITPMFLFWKAVPLVFAFLLIFIWFIVCWTACPFCRCCRCCVRQRQTSMIMKGISFAIMAAMAFGIVVAALTSIDGYNTAVAGFDNMACTSAKLLNTTLGGHGPPTPFIGMMPLLDVFWKLEKELDDNTDFLIKLDAIMSSTQPISKAMTVATGTIDMLKDMMAMPVNNEPLHSGTSLHHKCDFCTGMVNPLAQTSTALRDGIGSALASAREEVDRQLTKQKRKELQANVRTSTSPLKQVKESVRDTFGFFVDTEKFAAIKDLMDGDMPIVLLGVLLIVLGAFLLMLCGCLTDFCFIFKEKKAYMVNDQPRNPVNSFVHRCACCTWCCAFGYCILTFFIGGLLNALGVPMSSMCLIMDDLNSAMLKDIGPALNFNFTGDEGTMMLDMIDQCFVPTNMSQNAYLLDIIFVRENDTKVTMREKIVDQVKSQIKGQFDAIGGKDAGGNSSLANSTAVKDLRRLIQSNPVDKMIIPDASYGWANDANYKEMLVNAQLADMLKSHASCSSHTISQGLPANGTVIFGMSEFSTRIDQANSAALLANPSWSCAQKADCNSLPTSTSAELATKATCVAANNFMELKWKLKNLNTYRCDVWKDPVTGAECDPFNMAGTGNAWTGDCITANGTMFPRKQKTCNLAQFTTYVSQYDQRINKVMSRIDTATTQVFSGIDTDLRKLVDDHIVKPIDDVANGVTCGFLAKYYKEVVDGLCFQALIGFRTVTACYIGCAILSWILIVVMYAVWRRSIDNYNSPDPDRVIAVS